MIECGLHGRVFIANRCRDPGNQQIAVDRHKDAAISEGKRYWVDLGQFLNALS